MTDSMITYRRADGELMCGEWTFSTDVDTCGVDAEDADEPVEYVVEHWQLVAREDHYELPPLGACQAPIPDGTSPDGMVECEEDAITWVHDGETWYQACKEHSPGSTS